MPHYEPPLPPAVPRHPVYAALAPFPLVCFTLTLLTDIAYWRTSELMWQHFSEWLLFAGIVFGVVAVIAGALDYLLRRRTFAPRPAWVHGAGSIVVLLLAGVNSLVHAADGWTGVVPYGLALSAVTVIVIIVNEWFDRDRAHRHGIGVSSYD